ncbi:MAG: CDP-diacylglycerol--glycerol-3-phosphate 3-phosphatidyltransferase [Planctomycetes bacterium]|nr:CDP-diacylglycerol--glycerol-3-phosphate 3-phosphatidyltransferase [Planctomycetota bacterium]
MNAPNAITLGRLAITAACIGILDASFEPQIRETGIALIYERARPLAWVALALFLVAALTDFVDGWLARKLNQVTALGRVLDPFVDKVLVCGVLVVLLKFPEVQQRLPHWVVAVLIAREFLVTALRGLAETRGVPFPADRFGKLKMVAQSVTAALLIVIVARIDQDNATLGTVASVGVWTTLAATVGSGASYVWKARPIFAEP